MSLRGPKGLKIIPPPGGAKGSKSDLPILGKCAGGSSLKKKSFDLLYKFKGSSKTNQAKFYKLLLEKAGLKQSEKKKTLDQFLYLFRIYT